MYSQNDSTNDLVALVSGELDAQTMASRHGVSVGQIEQWRAIFVAGMRATQSGSAALLQRRARRRTLQIASVMTVGLALFISRQALSAACVGQPSLPAPLTVFCPDTPALAQEMNGNFMQVTDWLVQKVGALGSANITTTGTIAAGGAISGPSMSSSGTIAAGGAITGASLAVTGDVTATNMTGSGKLTAASYAPSYANYNTVNTAFTGQAGIVNDNANYKALMITGNTSNGGSRVVNMYDNVNVSGVLKARGTAVVLDVYACNYGGCCASGYQQKGQDLNEGAGGKFIYLCVKYADF